MLTKKDDVTPDEHIRFLFTVACVQNEEIWANSPLFSHHLKIALEKAFGEISTDFFLIEVVKASSSYSKLNKQNSKYEDKIKKLVPAPTLGHYQYWISGKKS